jgi:hypothetical protein
MEQLENQVEYLLKDAFRSVIELAELQQPVELLFPCASV